VWLCELIEAETRAHDYGKLKRYVALTTVIGSLGEVGMRMSSCQCQRRDNELNRRGHFIMQGAVHKDTA